MSIFDLLKILCPKQKNIILYKMAKNILELPLYKFLDILHSSFSNAIIITTLAFASLRLLETTSPSDRVITFFVGISFLGISILFSLIILYNLFHYSKQYISITRWRYIVSLFLLVQLFIFFHSLYYFRKDL